MRETWRESHPLPTARRFPPHATYSIRISSLPSSNALVEPCIRMSFGSSTGGRKFGPRTLPRTSAGCEGHESDRVNAGNAEGETRRVGYLGSAKAYRKLGESLAKARGALRRRRFDLYVNRQPAAMVYVGKCAASDVVLFYFLVTILEICRISRHRAVRERYW